MNWNGCGLILKPVKPNQKLGSTGPAMIRTVVSDSEMNRFLRYEELLSTPAREVATTATIYIPPGPRLGDVVIDAKQVNKAYGDKQLMKDLSFSIPQGAIVGVVG